MADNVVTHHPMSERGRKNLLDAMHGEAFAYAKYKLFAKQARKNGQVELADLFDRTADQEFFEHFIEEAELLGLVGNDEQDVEDAISGESFEIDKLYKDFAEQAKSDGDQALANRFEEIRRDETFHQLAFHEALLKLHARNQVGSLGGNSKTRDF